MADSKISALPASTTPLAGTEILPIVQSSTTKQVSVANLTAGRAISATQLTLTTGNLIVASGQGIDFSATSHPAGMTSELLSDYEEGTWTPTNTNALTVNSAKYTKIGRIVICTFDITANVLGTTGDMGGLPFNATNPASGGVVSYHNENGTETWSVNIEASGAAVWSFRLGSTQKQLSSLKNAKGMITYSL